MAQSSIAVFVAVVLALVCILNSFCTQQQVDATAINIYKHRYPFYSGHGHGYPFYGGWGYGGLSVGSGGYGGFGYGR